MVQMLPKITAHLPILFAFMVCLPFISLIKSTCNLVPSKFYFQILYTNIYYTFSKYHVLKKNLSMCYDYLSLIDKNK